MERRLRETPPDQSPSTKFDHSPTWQALDEEYDTQQLMDVVATVGTYNLVCMMLNSWGVQLDEGLAGFPKQE